MNVCKLNFAFFNLHEKIGSMPGYVARGPTVAQLMLGKWSPALDQFSCTESVLLFTGGETSRRSVEVYGNRLHLSLSDLPAESYHHAAGFVNGKVLLCGGNRRLKDCLKGEYNKMDNGRSPMESTSKLFNRFVPEMQIIKFHQFIIRSLPRVCFIKTLVCLIVSDRTNGLILQG